MLGSVCPLGGCGCCALLWVPGRCLGAGSVVSPPVGRSCGPPWSTGPGGPLGPGSPLGVLVLRGGARWVPPCRPWAPFFRSGGSVRFRAPPLGRSCGPLWSTGPCGPVGLWVPVGVPVRFFRRLRVVLLSACRAGPLAGASFGAGAAPCRAGLRSRPVSSVRLPRRRVFALAGVAIFIKRDELKETRCVSQFDFLWAEVRPVRLDFFALRGGLCPKGWSLRGAEIL